MFAFRQEISSNSEIDWVSCTINNFFKNSEAYAKNLTKPAEQVEQQNEKGIRSGKL